MDQFKDRIRVGIIAFASLLLCQGVALAIVDEEFTRDGVTARPETCRAFLLQPDGRIIAGSPDLIRWNPDGTRDETFQPEIDSTWSVLALAFDQEGRILVGGSTGKQIDNQTALVRLLSKGKRDATFAPEAGVKRRVVSLFPQTDGNVVAITSIRLADGTSLPQVERFNEDGSFDESFTTVLLDASAYCGALLPGGKILIAGSFTTAAGIPRKGIVRLESDGTVDGSFDARLGPNGIINGLKVLADGKILVCGSFSSFDGEPRSGVARLEANGRLDTTFDAGSFLASFTVPVTTPLVYSLDTDSQERIVVGGGFWTIQGVRRNTFVRLLPDGALDHSFDTAPPPDNPYGAYNGANRPIRVVKVSANNQIVVGGEFDHIHRTARHGLAVLNEDATLDQSFNPETATDGPVRELFIQSDGRILVGGHFTSYNGFNSEGIARLNSNGTLDTSFRPPFDSDYNITKIIEQPDHKLLIAGEMFVEYPKPLQPLFFGVDVGRLLPDGRVDPTFHAQHFNSGPYDLALQSDGRILVIGNQLGNPTAVTRLESNGETDFSFKVEDHPWPMKTLALQEDGKIVLGGESPPVTRLESNGKVDRTFQCDFSGVANRILMLDGGKLLVGGESGVSTNSALTNISGLIRLNPNGSRDDTFKSPEGPNGPIRDMVLNHDGSVIIGGNFTEVAGLAITNLARFLPDGTLDETFRYSFSPNEEVKALAKQDESTLLIGGSFLSVNGVDENFIARLAMNVPRIRSVSFSSQGRPTLAVVALRGAKLAVEYSSNLKTWTNLTQINDAEILTNVEDTSEQNGAFRFYRVINAE